MRPLLWLCLPFCAAVALSVYGLTGALAFLVATLSFPLAAIALLFHGYPRAKCLLAAVGWGLGFLWCVGYQHMICAPAQHLIGTECTFTACVTSYPQETDYGHSVEVVLSSEAGSEIRALLYLEQGSETLVPGDTLSGTGNFVDASVRLDHTNHTYTAQGIFVLGKRVKLSAVQHERENHPRWWLVNASHWLTAQIQTLYDADSAGLLRALTAGDQSGLSDRFRSDLSRTGLSHITAVSGLHLVFFVEFLFLLPGRRRWKSLLALPLLALFVLFTGASPSVVRAAVMEGILLLGNLLRRDYDSWTALTAALFVLLLENPWAIGSIGLQLSFASVAGIRLFLPQWNRTAEAPSPLLCWLRRLGESIALTLSATVFTLPLCVYYFDTISLIAPLSNLAVLWCIPLLMGGGFLTGFLSGVAPPLAQLVAIPVAVLAKGLVAIIHWLSLRPFAALDGSSSWMRLWLLVTYLLFFLFRLRKPKGWKRVGWVGLSLVTLVALVFGYRQTMASNAMTTQVLDVGQGQCILFVSEGHAAVVDCGGSGMVSAGDTLANALELLGIRTIDALILTHYDNDHTNGLEPLLERTTVTRIFGPTPKDASGEHKAVERLCAQYSIPWTLVTQDQTTALGAGTLTLFAPTNGSSSNDAGLVVLSSVNHFDLLVTGDLSQSTEKKFLASHRLPDIEVLVAGHHGSKNATCDKLLEATTPEVAVISVGEDNSYGHPNQDTLDRLNAHRITVYRTDLNGTITIGED